MIGSVILPALISLGLRARLYLSLAGAVLVALGVAFIMGRSAGKEAYVKQREIAKKMDANLSDRGFSVEAVLMKSIALPAGLARAIEEKLQAEQNAERMQFLIERERLEADRKRIEATAQRDAQKILAEGLTPEILRLRAIEAFLKLAESPNAKVIVTDGKAPLVTGN